MGMSSTPKKISIGHEGMDIKKALTIEDKCNTRSVYRDEKNVDFSDVSKSNKNHRKYMGKKPAEVFRTDFITAMKMPDYLQLLPNEYLLLNDPWRQEWEKGVQVAVNPEKIPKPVVRDAKCLHKADKFSLPTERIKFNEEAYVASCDRSTTSCDYDLDDVDMQWLCSIKSLRTLKKATTIDELTMERAITWFERECFEKMAHAVATKEGLSIEYDETTTCNVCLSPDAEDGNEIIFCDACNMCAHQHCYGVLEIPEGNWLCNPCSRGILSPPCCLCPNKGGAMKRMKDSFEWIHVICAWWVPEVKIEDVTYIERITKDKIPNTRWNLTCSICWEKEGACIQCSVKRCVRAYHITCAVKEGLEMKTVVLPENDDVQHISFCSKHCSPLPPEKNPHLTRSGEDLENNRLKELRKLESEFYKLVSVCKASRHLKLSREVTRRLLSYWAMKRRANDNTALIQLTLEQQEKLSGKQGVVFINQQKTLEMERFLLLRQDLERLRNLCYMIVRREKMRKELHRSSIEIFHKQNDLLLDKNEDLSGDNIDFIRHRTTRFSRFSEYYQTEKEFEKERGIKAFDDTSLDEKESHLDNSNIENLKQVDQSNCTSNSLTHDDNIITEKSDSERNIFELLVPKAEDDASYTSWSTKKSLPDISVDEPKKKHTKNLHVTSKKSSIKKNSSPNERMLLRNTVINKTENGRTSIEVENNAFDTFNKFLDTHTRENGFMKYSEEKLSPGQYIERNCISETAPISNKCVDSNTELCKRHKKRFRNLHNCERQVRRNSPRLQRRDDNSISSNGELTNSAKDSLGERISKLIIETKRRRLNSTGDYPSNIKDEPPDYVRITRSRSSCSSVTGTA